MRKILAEKKTDDLFTSQMIKDSFAKVTEISLHEVININGIYIFILGWKLKRTTQVMF